MYTYQSKKLKDQIAYEQSKEQQEKASHREWLLDDDGVSEIL